VDPNTRIQDYHEKMLCEECEQIFSDWEGKFASHVFYPHVRNRPNRFEYEEWLYRFVLSVSWRLLVSDMAAWHEFERSKINIIEERLEIWRQVLIDEKPLSEDPSSHHIFFVDELDLVTSNPEAPHNYEIYMQRNLDGTSVFGDNDIHAYFKFPKMLFFSTISPSNPDGFTGTEIEEEGVIEPPQELGPKWGEFLYGRIEKASQVSMSDHERKKVEDRILEDPEQYLESDFLEAEVAEMRRQWAEHDLLDHLDEDECSVCSTNHRVVESLPKLPLTKAKVEHLDQDLPFARATFPREKEVIDEIPTNVTDVLVDIYRVLYPDFAVLHGTGMDCRRRIRAP
jgi:hypothetical protein